jgi:hypothetical protein
MSDKETKRPVETKGPTAKPKAKAKPKVEVEETEETKVDLSSIYSGVKSQG